MTAIPAAGAVPAFAVEVAEDAAAWVVRVSGELDAATGQQLHTVLTQLVGQGRGSGGRDSVVVDLTGVPFMDSTGLGVIVKAAGQLRRQERRLRVSGVQPAVRELFTLSRLERLLS